MNFLIPEDKYKLLSDWIEEQDRIIAERQQRDEAYYGAIGGGVTYQFTPTSLGVVCKVRHALTNAELDLTDYENW